MAADQAQPTAQPTALRELQRAAALTTLGCAALAIVEYVATLWSYPSNVNTMAALRLFALDVALVLLLWPVAFALVAGAIFGARGLLRVVAPRRLAGWPGLFVVVRRRETPPPARALPWVWAALVGAAVYVLASTWMTLWLAPRFNEPELEALVLALLQLLEVGIAAAATYGTGRLVALVSRELEPRLGRWNPAGHVAPAVLLATILFVVAVQVAILILPQLGPLVPWRHLLAAAAFAGGAWAGALLLSRRTLLPRAGAARWITLAAVVAAALALVPLALFRIGADPETKYLAVTSSPTLSRIIDLVRRGNDFDGDGFGSLLGENDCAPFDAKIRPGARDVPDNGIDENCDGRDFSLSAMPAYTKGERMPVPAEFLRDWNFLLVTIDTVRFDHTSFGGYVEKRGRDTTPNLAKLVERSTSFDFTVAPSAGTMASVPAILTSKFFHSGIALDEKVKRGAPPKLMKENTLISEIIKRSARKYETGAILTHEYFNDWGMEQGFDTYDNALGKKPDAYRVSADKVTDRALAWIAKHASKPWFLWTHYIDPHGRYVAHPGDTSYGSTEEDLYDGELAFTDKHLGRLLEELARIPGGDRTVIIVTSDHGDGFNEHGFINHGMQLYRELLHVPMIIYVPNLEPKRFQGVVSNLDIVPTMADLAGIDVSDLSFEGESLVPQLFYGRENPERVVFSETNYPKPLRAAVTDRYKLIYHLANNLYELYDLEKDPWEKTNISSRDDKALSMMKRYLDDWLERVYYARDPVTNQAAAKLADVLLTERPTPANPIGAKASFDGGRIEVIGWDSEAPPEGYGAGAKASFAVYFAAIDKPSGSFKLQLELRGPAGKSAKSASRTPAEGLFATERWRPGEFVRDRFKIKIPADWLEGEVTVGLRMASGTDPVTPAGPTADGDPGLLVLGTMKLGPPVPKPPK